MNKKEILEKVEKLQAAFDSGEVPQEHKHEVNPGLDPGSRENYLYFTLPPALNFQRNSPAMWASALKTWEDPATNYLFFPEKVVETKYEKVQQDITKHKLALQKNRHTDIWTRLSQTFAELFQGDPRELLKQHDYDAEKIIAFIQVERKKDFPYLSGPKMTNYWLFILSHYSDIALKNRHAVSIIPDTHIRKSTVQLGLAPELVSPQKTNELWRDLLDGTDTAPMDLHSMLWNWSRNNFQPDV